MRFDNEKGIGDSAFLLEAAELSISYGNIQATWDVSFMVRKHPLLRCWAQMVQGKQLL